MAAARIVIVGIGMGPEHLTPEAAAALRTADYVLAAQKHSDDQLLAVRRSIADAFELPVVAVVDPPRDRDDPADYGAAVRTWHESRVDAYERELRVRGGTAAFLVWGDPSLYDSTIRVVERLAERMPLEYEVTPGISAPQILAARHRIVLHPVGAPVHITTSRRLRDDVAAGQRNVVVMLTSADDFGSNGALSGYPDWSIWWGANIGTPSEELVAGRVDVVTSSIIEARARAKAAAGWVMDIYLMRAP